MEKKGKLLNKIFSDTSASQYRFSILVTLIIFALLSVSSALALTTTLNAPGSTTFEYSVFMINATTDFNANCSYNISDGNPAHDLIATLPGNDTLDHTIEDVVISSLDDGSINIDVYCYNSSDGISHNASIAETKDTTPPTVDWNTPAAASVHSLYSTEILLNVSANATNSRGLNQSKTDIFDVSDCGGSLDGNPVFVNGVNGDWYVLQNWTAPGTINVNCTLTANVTTAMDGIANQSSRNVSVHPKCGDNINQSMTLGLDITGCSGNALEIIANSTTFDCDGHTISGDYTGSGIGILINQVKDVTITGCTIYGFNDVGNEEAGIQAENFPTGQSDINITGNTFYDNAYTLYFTYPITGLTVSGNTFQNSTDNHIYADAVMTDVDISGNVMTASVGHAINLDCSNGAELYDVFIENNDISNSSSGFGNGLMIDGCGSGGETLYIEGNNISDFLNGIILWGAGDDAEINISASNDIHDNTLCGINASDNPDVLIWSNNIYDNTLEVCSDAALQVSNGSVGNYWGRSICPYFIAGTDSNAANVIDSYPFNETDGWLTHGAGVCSTPNVTVNTPGGLVRMYNVFNFSVNVTDLAAVTGVTIWNGTANQPMQLVDGTSTDGLWAAVVYLSSFSDGARTLAVNATNGGNYNDSVFFSVTVDNTGPVILADFPDDNYNTSSTNEDFDYNITDALASAGMNCSVYLYNSSGSIIDYNTNSSVTNNTIVENTLSFVDPGVYTWNVTCYDGAVSNVITPAIGNSGSMTTQTVTYDATGPIINSFTVAEDDRFVSDDAANNKITLLVNASDSITGVKYITANMTDLSGDISNADFENMTYNAGTGLWNLTVTVTDSSTYDFEPVNITLTAYDYADNADVGGVDFYTAVLYNMTTPPMQNPCLQFSTGTTDFSSETDFEDVDFTVVVDWFYSVACQYYGIGADSAFHTVARVNFTGLNMSDDVTVQKLSGLQQALDVDITPDNNFGNSRVYINSTYFEELNTTATVALYNLPFDNVPAIVGDVGAAGYDAGSIVYTTYTHPTFGEVGNLTFNVDGFSGYNISDSVNPLITVNAPSPNLTIVSGTTPLVNVTVNGTGTQISNLTIVLDGTYYYMDDMTCYNATGSELMNCYFNPTVSDGTHQLNILVWDYGGAAPGNSNTTVWNFTSDSSPPSVTNNQSNVTGIVTDDTVIMLNLTATDTTNVSNVTANGVLMGNHTASAYNLTTTPAALGCTASGTCTVYFNATDYFGNVNNTAVTTFTVDVGPPSVTVVSVTNATNVSSSVAVNIQATVADPATVASVVANGNTMYLLSGTTTSGVWYANLTASDLGCANDANCTIAINATDTLSNYNDTETATYYVDETNPAVTVPSASPDEVKSASALYIGAVVTDVSNVTSVVSNNSVDLTQGASSWNATTSAGALGCAANGVCTIGFTATDMAGNINNTVTTTVIVDDTAPVATFVYNSTALLASSGAVVLNITVSELNTISGVTANGLAMSSPSTDGNYTIATTGTLLGCTSTTAACLITFVANDTAGNSGTTTTNLQIDNDGPVVTSPSVTNATSGKQKIGTVVNIAVTVSDSPAGVSSVKVNGTTMYLIGGTWQANVSGTTLGCAANSLCTLGFNATDSLGNSNTTVTTTYTTDNTAPSNTTAFSASGTTTSTVTATMNEAAKCTINYGTNESNLSSSVNSSTYSTSLSASFSTSASTVYYYNITDCWDELGNSGSLDLGPFNFTTSAANTGGGGGGGGGGSYTVSSTVELGDLTGAMSEMELGRGDTMSFSHNSEQHSVEVESLGTNYAEFVVMSTPQAFRLYVGQSKDVDLDGDTKADINVKLLDIISSKALVSLTSLLVSDREQIKLLPPAKRTPKVAEPELVDAAPETAVAPAEPAPAAAPVAEPAQPVETVSDSAGTPWYWYAFGALIAIIVISIIVMVIIEKRRAQ